nr:MAG TPA: hypothetical protein [Caudoviricetes sp.]DAZ70983.1 MAG TPA: hypothetical protein [Caudoviricetes sp.]
MEQSDFYCEDKSSPLRKQRRGLFPVKIAEDTKPWQFMVGCSNVLDSISIHTLREEG